MAARLCRLSAEGDVLVQAGAVLRMDLGKHDQIVTARLSLVLKVGRNIFDLVSRPLSVVIPENRLHLDEIDDAVLPPDKKALIQEVLVWYQKEHPIWFRWLQME